jgi:hypothetical protein
MRSKSSRQSSLNLVERQWVANRWSSRRLAEEMMDSRKDQSEVTKSTNGHSSSLAVDNPSTSSLLMVDVQAMNLFSGREISRRRKSNDQPRIIFFSERPASALSLSLASMLLWGMGSLGWFSHAVASMARSAAACPRATLLEPGMSTVRPMMLPM